VNLLTESLTIWNYSRLKKMLEGKPLPAMIVDLDAFDANTEQLLSRVRSKNKKLRIASKSLRVPALLHRLVERGSEAISGIMTYSAHEAQFLSTLGFDHFLQAYPQIGTVEMAIAKELVESRKDACWMVDSEKHVEMLSAFWRESQKANPGLAPLKICIDADMSYRSFGGRLHLGVYRSPVRTLQDFSRLFHRIQATPELKLAGVMGYEAQIAGLAEKNPFSPMFNPIKQWIKKISVHDVFKKRAAISQFLKNENSALELFNGGGTGSLTTTSREPWITEVTAGSGFLQSHLFDYYADNTSIPAFAFALPIARIPEPGIITCHSGGFIGSGETSLDKNPLPFLPQGLRAIKTEGFGEVQTPLARPAHLWNQMQIGDPIFFRPAKSGEIAERFSHYLLVKEDQIIDTVPTYRGCGKCFF
jgi:D-serine deaminase-like pyridoxal phosphate-dependent protein